MGQKISDMAEKSTYFHFIHPRLAYVPATPTLVCFCVCPLLVNIYLKSLVAYKSGLLDYYHIS